MNELIKISENNGKKVVSAKELYLFLDYDISNWSKWYKKNIIENEFAIENEDWCSFVHNTNVDNQIFNPNPSVDFSLSIDFAKKLSMMARTIKGEQARNYFIECEKISQSLIPNFNNPVEAARSWADEMERKLLAEAKVKELEPKAVIYDQISNADNLLDFNKAAKILNTGRNKLMKQLKENGILMNNNTPYQQFIDSGYFIVKVKVINFGNKESNYSQTFITGKGLTWLSERI